MADTSCVRPTVKPTVCQDYSHVSSIQCVGPTVCQAYSVSGLQCVKPTVCQAHSVSSLQCVKPTVCQTLSCYHQVICNVDESEYYGDFVSAITRSIMRSRATHMKSDTGNFAVIM